MWWIWHITSSVDMFFRIIQDVRYDNVLLLIHLHECECCSLLECSLTACLWRLKSCRRIRLFFNHTVCNKEHWSTSVVKNNSLDLVDLDVTSKGHKQWPLTLDQARKKKKIINSSKRVNTFFCNWWRRFQELQNKLSSDQILGPNAWSIFILLFVYVFLSFGCGHARATPSVEQANPRTYSL